MVKEMTPEALEELQDMSREQAEQIDELCYGDSLSKRRVVRKIIYLSAEELSWQGRTNANSLRDFWYNPCKPILENLFPNEYTGAGTSKFNRRMSQLLSDTMSEIVKDEDREITYRSLNILDDSRDREINTDTIESDKILFVEKNSAYRKLKPLEENYGISIVSGSGWQATALIEDMVHEIDTSKEYTIYLLSDHDPTGHGIAADFAERAEQFGMNVREIRRVGIYPEQVEDETVERQKFRVADPNKEWVDEHGIDGEAYGLELEAVGGDLNNKAEALREMVVEEIKDDIKEDRRRARDRLNGYADAIDSATTKITEELDEELTKEGARILEEESEVIEEAEAESGVHLKSSGEREVIETDESIAPTIYDNQELHEGAQEGQSPKVDNRHTEKEIRKGLIKEIDEGNIKVKELIGG